MRQIAAGLTQTSKSMVVKMAAGGLLIESRNSAKICGKSGPPKVVLYLILYVKGYQGWESLRVS